MKLKFVVISMLSAMTLSFANSTHRTHGHEFAPQNNLRIPVTQNFSGIEEADFDAVLDEVAKIYEPVFKEHDAELVIDRYWKDQTVNAYAFREGKEWHIAMYGGLARHKEVTRDGFMLVACHEIGHHLGGFPRGGWASNEGNSDYYGTLKCLRRIWDGLGSDSIEVVNKMKVDKTAADACETQWKSAEEQAVCKRSAMAGKGLARLLAVLGGQEMPEFDTPDTTVVTKTSHSHPRAQCRLDTYFHGALCTLDWKIEMDEKDPNIGACKAGEIGGRRFCWYRDPIPQEPPQPPDEDTGDDDEGSIRW